MKDVLMETVWKRREQLLREHGGMDGVLQEVARIETEQLEAEKRKRLKLKKRKSIVVMETATLTTGRGRQSKTAVRSTSSR